MEQRDQIPVTNFYTQVNETSNFLNPNVQEQHDCNEQDSPINLYILLEDNIVLKKNYNELKLQLDEFKKLYDGIKTENLVLSKELAQLKLDHDHTETELKELMYNYNQMQNKRDVFDNSYDEKKTINLNSGSQKLAILKPQYKKPTIVDSIEVEKIKNKTFVESIDGDKSIIDGRSFKIDGQIFENVAKDFFNMKQMFNSIELQLYEENEKILELYKNQERLENENKALRLENRNLTEMAKFLAENMKETVETSKKMELALIKLNRQNNKLAIFNKKDISDDYQKVLAKTDSLTDIKINSNVNNNFIQIADKQPLLSSKESTTQSDHHSVSIEEKTSIEMFELVEVKDNLLNSRNTTDKLLLQLDQEHIKKLEIRVAYLEEELCCVSERAEKAEQKLKESIIDEESEEIMAVPPPPPPLPTELLYKPQIGQRTVQFTNKSLGIIDAASNLRKNNNYNSEKNWSQKVSTQYRVKTLTQPSTGIDALVMELKSGRVSLRKSTRQTQGSKALQEMFQVLEINQK